jgi:ATP-dependent helicase/nuclease subunit A
MTEIPFSDAEARAQALDPRVSFIVQAPAGSGKTGLLTQRLLVLLAGVNEPEEVLAITFTRKAAAEMRQRVVEALRTANGPRPSDSYARQNWQLANAVRARDEALGWQLGRNPNRLRIQTFDALNHSLARQLPLTSSLGGTPTVTDDPDASYRSAARRTLALLDDKTHGDDIARVLTHVDNRRDQLEQLLCTMLARRDQWLGHSVKQPDSARIVDDLGKAVAEQLATLHSACPAEWLTGLCRIAAVAGANLRQAGKTQDALACHATSPTVPQADWPSLPHWQALANLLLTAKGEPRRTWNKGVGILSPNERGIDAEERAIREDCKSGIAALTERLNSDPEFATLWRWIPQLPTRPPSTDQQALLEALLRVLLRAATELSVVFAETGEMDFAEVQMRALNALGDTDQPSDLALALDHRLRHLLIDEFQDTSISQFQLLRRLTSGWMPDDGRTLFAVGDPMQSIYRFREAEVGLFLHAWTHGIGDVSLHPLRLTVNFRSTAGIVDWVNAHFPRVLAPRDDPVRGAVSFAPAVAFDRREPPESVALKASLGFNAHDEAAEVCRLAGAALEETDDGKIAVLARARSHLVEIAYALNQSGIPFQAVDIAPLSSRPVVRDLRALTRALLHPADRLSWLTILHAPWIGIPLEDLIRIAEPCCRTVLSCLRDEQRIAQVSPDSRARIERLLQVLQQAGDARGRRPLREWVESIWLRLGGLAMAGAVGESDADAFFALLEQHAEADGLGDFAALDEAIEGLFASSDSAASARVQLMTMHKAKGLEFDTVILPGLGRRPRSDPSELLYWMETTGSDRANRLSDGTDAQDGGGFRTDLGLPPRAGAGQGSPRVRTTDLRGGDPCNPSAAPARPRQRLARSR